LFSTASFSIVPVYVSLEIVSNITEFSGNCFILIAFKPVLNIDKSF
jgi:hypothetical protein